MTHLLRRALQAPFRQRAAFFLAVLTVFALAGGAAMLLPPVWRTSALITVPPSGPIEREQAASRMALEAAQSRLDAFRQDHPVSPRQPNPRLYVLLALPAGLLGGLAMAFLAETLSGTFAAPDEVERRLGLPVLAVLPFES